MYCVVQLDEKGGEGLAVVHESWLTPLKKEVFWPPIKDSKLYRKALVDSEVVDNTCWALYGIQKMYFQTNDLNKAFKKEKEAEVNSDIYDTDDVAVQERPMRKRIPKIIESDSDDDDSRYSRPPQVKIKKISSCTDKKQIPSTSKEQCSTEILGRQTNCLPGITKSYCTEKDKPSCSKEQISYIPVDSSMSSSVSRASPICQRTPDITESNLTVFINILNTVKEQNKVILHKLENVEKIISTDSGQIVGATGNSGNPLPIELPLKNDEDVVEAEKFLEEKNNFARLVNYLGSLGGTNVKNKIHKTLRHLLSNDVASKYSYFGKKGKKIFSDLNINKAVIETTQLKIQGASLEEIENIIKTWLKHAPDRKKGQKENELIENNFH